MTKDSDEPEAATDAEGSRKGRVVSHLHTTDGSGAQRNPATRDEQPVAADGVTGTEASDTYEK
jgi:hypothetical protein